MILDLRWVLLSLGPINLCKQVQVWRMWAADDIQLILATSEGNPATDIEALEKPADQLYQITGSR